LCLHYFTYVGSSTPTSHTLGYFIFGLQGFGEFSCSKDRDTFTALCHFGFHTCMYYVSITSLDVIDGLLWLTLEFLFCKTFFFYDIRQILWNFYFYYLVLCVLSGLCKVSQRSIRHVKPRVYFGSWQLINNEKSCGWTSEILTTYLCFLKHCFEDVDCITKTLPSTYLITTLNLCGPLHDHMTCLN